jgi:hypothetical protein
LRKIKTVEKAIMVIEDIFDNALWDKNKDIGYAQ